jgi:hypothetical protein
MARPFASVEATCGLFGNCSRAAGAGVASPGSGSIEASAGVPARAVPSVTAAPRPPSIQAMKLRRCIGLPLLKVMGRSPFLFVFGTTKEKQETHRCSSREF